ncbi:MAG TPA: sulfocyanin-like copper-binding protein [Chloroflexota bacterium]|nr:sulfocyanin-like copper-binding protein [Chloroflexota bacterium]
MTMRPYRLAGALALSLTLAAGAGGIASAHQTKAPTWITTKGKTVNLTVTAAYQNAMGGFSFNGYNNGKLTITVPAGDTVNVTFSNDGTIPHSAQIVAGTKAPTSSVSDAFKGAQSPNPTNGTPKGKTQKFSFKASKAGKYLLICAVPGHAAAGMWDNFVVSSSAKSGSIKTSK